MHVEHMRKQRSEYTILVGNLAGNRPLERPRRGWEDNIKMILKEYNGRALVNTAMNLRVP